MLRKRHEKIGGGPTVGHNFVAHKTEHVITKEVLMVQYGLSIRSWIQRSECLGDCRVTAWVLPTHWVDHRTDGVSNHSSPRDAGDTKGANK